jgi:predicted DNA-binding transcriptional regulator YafY
MRLSRLTAILTHLQAKRLITATELASKFGVSVRTIYRDIRALEASGVPIYTEEGKGYCLMEGYRLPPVMFTQEEANALITAEQLILKNKDASLSKHYSEAIEKIKSVLRYSTRDKVDLLSKRILVKPQIILENTSDNLGVIQQALTSFQVIKIVYQAENQQNTTSRMVEPFAIYTNEEGNWSLVAFCRLRQEFRVFRLDRISALEVLAEIFEPHKMTIEEFKNEQRKKYLERIKTPDIPLS